MKWFRFYSEVLHDSKVQTLSPEVFRAWVNLLCLANEGPERGVLPEPKQVAFALRVREDKAVLILDALTSCGLLDRDEDGILRPHNWTKRQRDSDDVAARVRESRRKARASHPDNGHVTEHVTGRDTGHVPRSNCRVRPDSETDSETDTDPEQPPPSPGGGVGAAVADGTSRPSIKNLVDEATTLHGPDVGREVAHYSHEILGTFGEELEFYRAAMREAKRTGAEIKKPHRWFLRVARGFRDTGLPPAPASISPAKGKSTANPYTELLAEMGDD